MNPIIKNIKRQLVLNALIKNFGELINKDGDNEIFILPDNTGNINGHKISFTGSVIRDRLFALCSKDAQAVSAFINKKELNCYEYYEQNGEKIKNKIEI